MIKESKRAYIIMGLQIIHSTTPYNFLYRKNLILIRISRNKQTNVVLGYPQSIVSFYALQKMPYII